MYWLWFFSHEDFVYKYSMHASWTITYGIAIRKENKKYWNITFCSVISSEQQGALLIKNAVLW